MSFPSIYNGTCSKCSKAIAVGEQVTWSRKVSGQMHHAVCGAAAVTPIEMDKTGDVKSRSLKQNFCDYCKAVFNGQERIAVDTLGSPYHEECMKNKVRIMLEKAVKKEEKTVKNDNNPMSLFADAIAPLVQEKLKSTLDEAAVKKIVDAAVIEAGFAKKLEIKNLDTGDIATIETPHKDLKTLLYYISKRQHVYLYGPAGSGKSTAAQHCAEALKIEFGYISLNPQTPDSRILGFVDAGGTYRETAFYKCYKNGGIFCIDEMDNASASLLTTLNSMLENGHGAFPNGLVQRHASFVLVATGNTNGRGGNPMFPERRPFDAAFAERFTFLFWDYDMELEKAVALSINPQAGNWINYVKKLREYCAKTYPRILVSPRASFKGAEYLKDSGFSMADIAEAVIFKGLDKDTVTRITNVVPYPQIKGMVTV